MRGIAVVSRTSSLVVRMAVSRIATSRLTVMLGFRLGKKEVVLPFGSTLDAFSRRSRFKRALISWVTGDCRTGVCS